MRIRWLHVLAFTLALSAALPAPLGAQWLNLPTPGTPRLPDGSPNLNAPAPRTADGKPDLSGIWDIEHNRPCPPEGCPDMAIGQEFLDISWGLKRVLPYQPWAAELVKKRIENFGIEDPMSTCRPIGAVKGHTTPQFRKFIQLPGLLLILKEINKSYRQIFTDGRSLPEINQPSADGYSVGKWEGDTLVVETVGFKDDGWLDHNGSPLTEAAKVTERFRRMSYGKMEIEITVDDPKAYTAPWTIRLNHSILPDTELLEYICLENLKTTEH
jgi:hypothetical protein